MHYSKSSKYKLAMLLLLAISLTLLIGCKAEIKVDERPKTKGFVWTATKGNYTVNLIGTMHPAPTTHNLLNDDILAILEETDVLSVEVDLTDNASLTKLQNGILLPKDETIDQYLSKDEIEKLNSILKDNNQNTSVINNLNPSGISSIISNLISLNAGFIGKSSDEILINYAKTKNIEINELEGVDYQIDILNTIYTWRTVKDYIDIYSDEFKEKSVDDLKKLFDAYVTGDTNIPQEMNNEQKATDPESYDVMVTTRNKEMAQKIDTMISDGKRHTIAVGCRHFIGDDSILTELESNGYTITKL